MVVIMDLGSRCLAGATAAGSDALWSEGRGDPFEEIVAQDAISHSAMGDAYAEGWKQGVGMLWNGFPDLCITIEDELAEGDKVVQQLTIRDTHQGELFGVPATGREVVWPAIAIFRLSGGKIAEIWTEGDTWGMMRQIGAVPSP